MIVLIVAVTCDIWSGLSRIVTSIVVIYLTHKVTVKVTVTVSYLSHIVRVAMIGLGLSMIVLVVISNLTHIVRVAMIGLGLSMIDLIVVSYLTHTVRVANDKSNYCQLPDSHSQGCE